MPSPPAGHPFLRQQVPATLSSPDSASQPGTSYYRSLTSPLSEGSVAGSALTQSRPESRASAARSSQLPPERSRSPNTGAVTANGNGSIGDSHEAPRKLSRWEEKVQGDLAGWRGGEGKPRSSVPQAGAPSETYFGQPTTGVIGQDLPKEIVRIERDWSLGDICQFSTSFPLELESRITPALFSTFIESLNEPLGEAYSLSGAVIDNLIAIATWWTSLLWRSSHFEKELLKAEETIRKANETTFNPAGLNILTPRDNALQFLEIEYY